jgi:hypothetical protein
MEDLFLQIFIYLSSEGWSLTGYCDVFIGTYRRFREAPSHFIQGQSKPGRITNLLIYENQRRTQEFFSCRGGGFNKFSWRQREQGSGGGNPLVRGSGGSCNLVQEISFHIVKFSLFLVL